GDHGVGVGAVPGLQRLGVVRIVGGEAGLQRLDQTLYDSRRPTFGGQAEFHSRPCQRRGQVNGVERLPCLVVVRADRVGDTPARDGEIGIELERAVEATDRLFVI